MSLSAKKPYTSTLCLNHIGNNFRFNSLQTPGTIKYYFQWQSKNITVVSKLRTKLIGAVVVYITCCTVCEIAVPCNYTQSNIKVIKISNFVVSKFFPLVIYNAYLYNYDVRSFIIGILACENIHAINSSIALR